MEQQQRDSDAPVVFGVAFCLLASLWVASYIYWLYRSIRLPAGTYQAWYEMYMAYGLLAALGIATALAGVWALVESMVSLAIVLARKRRH